MRKTRPPNRRLRQKQSAKTIQPTGQKLTTSERTSPMADKTKDKRNRHRIRTRPVGKRRKTPVRDGLRDRPERKPIIMENYYAELNYTEILENDNDHVMIKIHLHGNKNTVTINSMINSGATEDFIDQEVCNKHGIKTIKATNPWEIYLADGKLSAMGPVTHIAKVPMDINSHRELANHILYQPPHTLSQQPTLLNFSTQRFLFNKPL